jgi:hypothetical protein
VVAAAVEAGEAVVVVVVAAVGVPLWRAVEGMALEARPAAWVVRELMPRKALWAQARLLLPLLQ